MSSVHVSVQPHPQTVYCDESGFSDDIPRVLLVLQDAYGFISTAIFLNYFKGGLGGAFNDGYASI